MKIMLNLALIVTVFVAFTSAQDDGEIIIPDNKTDCINKLVQWCNGMQYPQQGAGMSLLSVTYEDPNGFYRVLCSSDSDGTNCTRNQIPWFGCTPDNQLSYKGQIISNATASTDIDDEICPTADKALNELFVQNLKYDNTTLKNEVQEGFESFFDQMAAMAEQIDLIQRVLKKLFYINDLPSYLENSGQQPGTDMTTLLPNTTTSLPNTTTSMPDIYNQTAVTSFDNSTDQMMNVIEQ